MSNRGRPFRSAVIVGVPVDRNWHERVARDEAPRRDYLELARMLGADVIDASQVGGHSPFATAWGLAWTAFRRRREYDLVVSDSERAGLALALLMRGRSRPRHVMIAHRPATAAKLLLGRRLGLYRHIDRVLCYSLQRERLVAAGVEPWRALTLPHGLPDQRFWRPLDLPVDDLVVSAGREYRDYATLIEAARSLPVRVEIAAASPWSRRTPTGSALRNSGGDRSLPDNVRFVSGSYGEMRRLYARARLVVVPVREAGFQAGALVISEAMAMGKPVIASATEGQRDYIDPGVNGVLVPPAEPAALREAIQALLDRPDEAERLGREARCTVEEHRNLDWFLAAFEHGVAQLMEEEARAGALVPA